jgi:Tol biopolymer transport system component
MLALAVCVALATYSVKDVLSSASASGAMPRDVTWPVQLTTRSGLDLQPSLSPRGDEFAYVADPTGAFEIYVRALSRGAVDRPLTSDGAQNVQPIWSPDGRQIAYHSSARGGVWVIPAGGGSARQLVVQGSQPAWSPDGASIVFQSDEHADVTPSAWAAQAGSTLWQVAAAGGAATQLTFPGRPGGGHAAPVWSPDGRFVAFTVFDGGRDNGVWVLDVRTGATRPLVRGERLYELVFAPDGNSIYATGGESFIVRLPFDSRRGVLNGEAVTIPIGGLPGLRGLSISADGKTIAFAGISLSSHIWAQPIAADGIAAGASRAITSDTSRRNSLPLMSPDGSKIAYLSTRGGAAPDLWVMDADGTNAQQVVVDDASDPKLARKRWMPDSRRLAYVVDRDGDLMVSSIDVTTRREEQLFSTDEEDQRRDLQGQLGELQVSPSISQIAFSLLAPPEGRRRLYVSPLKAIEPRAVANHGESVGYPAWSPDERFIAVELKEGSSTHAATIEVATGNLRRLTNARGHTWVRSWSPDGRQVAAAVLRDGQWSLRAIDAATGRETIIVPPVPPRVYLRYPEWSPRNDVMLFERGELRGNIWTMSVQ